MPHLTKAHIRPSSFEKMKVNLAFTLFSEQVLTGTFLYKSHLQQSSSSITATLKLIKRTSRLIAITTSRVPPEALQPYSRRVADLEASAAFLNEWEEVSGKAGGGLISKSTTEDL